MRTFTIDPENIISVFASEKQAKAGERDGAEFFTTQEELAKLAGAWSGERLVQIWNSLTGVIPVKKFTDRKTSITRIWKAIQNLQLTASEGGKKSAAWSGRIAKGRASKSKTNTKATIPKKASHAAKGPRHGSKNAKILELLRRPKGVTLHDLTSATGWQTHSVRGFLSAVVGKKMGLKLRSIKREDSKRVYSMA